jgi:hypothetical protein
VNNERNISGISKASLFRGLTGIITVLLIMVKLASPFLHTHQFEESSSKSASISSVHCVACEYESTQAVEPSDAVILPTAYFSYESKVYDVISVFVSASNSASESRGPPQNS